MTALDTIKQIQGLIGVTQDGTFGPDSQVVFARLLAADPLSPWPPVALPVTPTPTTPTTPATPTPTPPTPGGQSVLASSFADPADYRAFQACKAQGKSDEECFQVGDNCIGAWGDPTGQGTGPKCALPPEVWQAKWGSGAAARHAKVLVQRTLANGSTLQVVCNMDDTMPHLANITNGAGIDLNPDACAALQLQPPVMARVTWQWVV